MSTATLDLTDLDIDFESVPYCEDTIAKHDPPVEAHWISKHPGCVVLSCNDCAERDMQTFIDCNSKYMTVVCDACQYEGEAHEFEIVPL